MKSFIKSIFLIVPILFFSACASKKPILNEPITKEKFEKLKVDKLLNPKDDLSLILTFSGGGTRAASLSYGVLKELKNLNLLDEVDVISSVSGGSFTSAYYGLYGDEIFEDFEDKFLKKPIQTTLIDTFLNPFNWFYLSFSGRSDYVADYYEEEIFGKKTFKDLRKDSPKIIINATDISTGNPFAFSPENFRRICSDWEAYPIGRAVTASSAVPILFSPITLKNYKGCSDFKVEEKKDIELSYNDEQSLGIRKYYDKENYEYLHLVDGGIADNLGIRSLLYIVTEHDNNFLKVLEEFGIPNSKRVALIVVNAADTLNPKIAKEELPPDISTTMGAVSTIQLTRYNSDTLDLMKYNFNIWKKQVDKVRCKDKEDCNSIEFYLIELNFKQLPKKEAKKFLLTQTSLELSSKRVDEIILAGQKLLKESKEFQKLLKDLGR
ncbi:patatin [Halarcobacter ebronensis]|uniref:Patatin n=1 Tax=Halarcobacter ebronensis TaxID=1462615 RepID=A0A4Q0YBK3_9BACT|nr:patatin-like phospholipase family protein [Halarcobacter ebronensis]RXJ67692.1 patatin [Halarcobacter ebronensis]